MPVRPALSGLRRLALFRGQGSSPLDLAVPGWECRIVDAYRTCELAAQEVPRPEQPVVITSPRAAEWFAARFPGHQGPIATAGKATASPLQKVGLNCLVPKETGGEAALLALASVLSADRDIFFPCGVKTAGTVEMAAGRLGLSLRQVAVYRLEPLPLPPLGALDALAFLSGQAVRMVRQGVSVACWQQWQELPVLATPTALAALETLVWQGKRFLITKTAQRMLDFDIPLLLTDVLGSIECCSG